MSVEDAFVYALVGLGVGLVLISCLGVALMGDVYDRLHYVAPSVLGAVLIVAAIWVREGPSTIALEGTLVAAFLLVSSPAQAHATARAARISEHGDWRRQRGEGIELEGQ
jgi:monovalent cation/proton antiporter MnhG/PhaG subunit